MPVRSSEAVWRGGIHDGDGEIALGSGAWQGGYSYRSRFEEEEPAKSNPEELIAAGHASCFSMALANILKQREYDPEKIRTEADCYLEMDEAEGPTITRIELSTEAVVPDIEEQTFQEAAQEAKRGCPISRALAGVDITVDTSRVTEESDL